MVNINFINSTTSAINYALYNYDILNEDNNPILSSVGVILAGSPTTPVITTIIINPTKSGLLLTNNHLLPITTNLFQNYTMAAGETNINFTINNPAINFGFLPSNFLQLLQPVLLQVIMSLLQ